MSASDNVTRLARRIQKLTGLRYCRARELAEQVQVFIKGPIPDAESPDQRRFEAMVVHTLANAFRGRQFNGTLLGVVRTSFSTAGLRLHLDADMADEVVAELLPRWDGDWRGVSGVPGLRPDSEDGQFTLRSALGAGRITVVCDDGTPLGTPILHLRGPRYRDALLAAERDEARYWARYAPPARDLLLSRILRHPALVNRAASAHGFANCYTRSTNALVIEWCCGDSLEALFAALLAHGMAEGLPELGAAELLSPSNTALIGYRTVVLRRHGSCVFDGTADLAALFRAEAVR